MNSHSPQHPLRTVAFLLAPNFTMVAFSAAIEALRLANRVAGFRAYDWRLVSETGEPARASNGVLVAVDGAIADERALLATPRRASLVLVCGGVEIERNTTGAMTGFVREVHARGVAVGGLCTGAYVIASAGLLSGRRCAIHWENLPGFAELFPDAEVYADLYEIDGDIHTCAGGTATLDMMLALIGRDLGEEAVNRICEQLLTDRVREAGDRQRLPLRARLGVHNGRVLEIIELMEANLAEPLSLLEIADRVRLSRRQIERLFRQEMGRSPARYYLEIRLDHARNLLLQSAMPVVEVAVACGFVSASHFSKCYREAYAKSPLQERAERRQLLVA
ncbi:MULTISPECIES: GlxA family transcriptional regulator [unclassified Roseitalea]|uniref:GlxA family transcriptional regulator n=1 Tax=unclassified Roseitalea TaxID=2639107 RepID=UPI00273CF662|nr:MULTISPECIES: GlxA family transcriptional regulator [unclassified Roseitalea]